MDKATEQHGVIKVLTDAYIGGKSRGISALYQGLLKSRGICTMYVKEKWERGLGIEITEKEWYNVFRIQHSTTAGFISVSFRPSVLWASSTPKRTKSQFRAGAMANSKPVPALFLL